MTRFTRRSLMSCLLAGALIVLASCGGDASSTREPDGNGSAAPDVTEASTTAPATTDSSASIGAPPGGFDGAVAEAFSAGLELAELRLACFDITDLSCLVSSEQKIVDAEKKVATALELVGTASVDAGVDVDSCQGPVATVVKNNSIEWSSLLERAKADGLGTKRFGEADWQHHRNKIGAETGTPGHAIAGVLLRCTDAVKDPSSELMSWVRAFVESSDFARIAFSYNLLTQFLCVDQPVDPSFPDSTCFEMLGSPDNVGFGRGTLENAYEKLTNDPRYSDLSEECRTAIDEANRRLMSSLEIFNNLAKRELVSTDTELQALLSQGLFQIDDQRRGSGAMFPFDEKMVLTCAAAAADLA